MQRIKRVKRHVASREIEQKRPGKNRQQGFGAGNEDGRNGDAGRQKYSRRISRQHREVEAQPAGKHIGNRQSGLPEQRPFREERRKTPEPCQHRPPQPLFAVMLGSDHVLASGIGRNPQSESCARAPGLDLHHHREHRLAIRLARFGDERLHRIDEGGVFLRVQADNLAARLLDRLA